MGCNPTGNPDFWSSRRLNLPTTTSHGINLNSDTFLGDLFSSPFQIDILACLGAGSGYPPYARSSSAYWSTISQDEAIVLGVISESELNEQMVRFKREPLIGIDGKAIPEELLQAALQEIKEQIYRNGGPPPDATRAQRVAHERMQREESLTRARSEHQPQCDEREDRDSVFQMLEQIEGSLRNSPSVQDSRRWDWLCKSLNILTATPHFDKYPIWRSHLASTCVGRLCENVRYFYRFCK